MPRELMGQPEGRRADSLKEAAVRGMLAVPPLYKNAPDAHAQLGGPSRNPGKARWLQTVNKLHRTRIASRRVDAKEVFVWSEANCNEDGSDPTGDETLDSLHDMLAQPHVKPKSAEHKATIRRYDTPRPLLRPPPQKE